MHKLRDHLEALSITVPRLSPSSSNPTRLAALSQAYLALLTHNPPTLHVLPQLSSSPILPSHPLPSDAEAIHPANDMLAITGPRSVTILQNPTQPPHPAATHLFETRPNLRLLHAAWSPHAHGFLMLLTSDGSLRLFDVVTRKSAAVERWRLRVVTSGGAPVSFAFGRGKAWDGLSVYVLATDGRIYVCSPIAPIGTRLPHSVWQKMTDAARRVLSRNAAQQVSPPNVSEITTPRRLLSFDDTSQEEDQSWAVRQAHMQIRFLSQVFEPSASGDMVAVREFKPAPLLFQGPLYVEHDDVDDESDDITCRYNSLTLLNCGQSVPPILLRTSITGQVSVLVGFECVEAQWFLSNDSFASSGEASLEASIEYSECARAVAPLLLCFEHLSFGNQPVTLFPLGGNTHADVIFAVSSNAVYSIRLSFISVISNSDALERTPNTTISQILTTAQAGLGQSENPILGLAASFVRGKGPVAIVVTADGNLHATAPITWIADFDISLPPRLLEAQPSTDLTWANQRPLTGSRAYTCPDAGKEVAELLKQIQDLQGKHSARVTPGTLGMAADVESYDSVLEFLENRVIAFTGGTDEAGIGDSLSSLASVLLQWGDELKLHASKNGQDIVTVTDILADVERSESCLTMKLKRVEQLGAVLKERMSTVLETIESENSELSPVEAERYSRLKEKKRRMIAIRSRIAEIAGAVKAHKRMGSQVPASDSYDSPLKVNRSAASTPRRSPAISNSPSWRDPDGPLARRRPEWSPQRDSVGLSRTELQQIKIILEKHSQDIGELMELSSTLWKRLSVT